MNNIKISSLGDIDKAAIEFIEQNKGNKLFAFYGEMGAGKTTFINAICKQLGVTEDIITSPTFSLVNEYMTDKGEIIFHFDLYRINKIEEIYDIGFEEYLDDFNYCFIEWPEIVEDILPPETTNIKITLHDNGSRIISS
jgi:tRNA threonylcarbamoyladenosine biosynthesis protein TsaE